MSDTFIFEGKEYYDIKTFAFKTQRTTQTIYRLKDTGNSIRKLRCEYILGKPMIPAEELTEFPFCAAGVDGAKKIHHFGGIDVD